MRAVAVGGPMSLENELYSIREIIGGLRADVGNIKQGISDNRESLTAEVVAIKKDLQEIKQNYAAVRGGWFALSGLLAASGTLGAGMFWFIKTVSAAPPTQ